MQSAKISDTSKKITKRKNREHCCRNLATMIQPPQLNQNRTRIDETPKKKRKPKRSVTQAKNEKKNKEAMITLKVYTLLEKTWS